MTDFEFIFVLYSLVLGFSMVALLSGFGKALEFKFAHGGAKDLNGSFTIGSLVPLLGVFVMLDLMSFWMFAWVVRGFVEVSAFTLLCVMTFASVYYLAARLVFPDSPESFRDLDTHYFRVRRTIMLLLTALVAVQWAWLLTLAPVRDALLTATSVGLTALFVVLMVAAAFVRSRRWSAVLLVALSVRYLVLYLQP